MNKRRVSAFCWDALVIRWGLKYTLLSVLLTAALVWLSRPSQQCCPSSEGQTLNALVAARA